MIHPLFNVVILVTVAAPPGGGTVVNALSGIGGGAANPVGGD
jgi:hypothetical protein